MIRDPSWLRKEWVNWLDRKRLLWAVAVFAGMVAGCFGIMVLISVRNGAPPQETRRGDDAVFHFVPDAAAVCEADITLTAADRRRPVPCRPGLPAGRRERTPERLPW